MTWGHDTLCLQNLEGLVFCGLGEVVAFRGLMNPTCFGLRLRRKCRSLISRKLVVRVRGLSKGPRVTLRKALFFP